MPPPPASNSPVPFDADDTNDDFCFRCHGGGDLLLCDKCDRSYHLYCVDPPLEVAPEGEWACPAHRPGARSRKKEEPLMELDMARGERGQRHKPPRVDAKYQIMPDAMLTDADKRAEAASGAPEGAGTRCWEPDRAPPSADAACAELLAFTHRLLHGETIQSEPRLNEHCHTHLHLCGYSLPLAKRTLLRAHKTLHTLSPSHASELAVHGYGDAEMLMALVGVAHGEGVLLRYCAPGALETLVGLPEVAASGLYAGAGGGAADLGDEASALRDVAAYEAELGRRCKDGVAAWNGAVDALLAKGSVSLEELKAAVDDGAAAHRADVRCLAPGGAAAVSTDLAALVASHAAAKAWHAACAEQLAKPVSPDVLAALLEEGAKVPLVTLAEMADLRGRLERMRAWEAAAQRVVGQPAEMRELTELQREAEALRIKTDEAEGLSSRTAACRKWMGRIHNELLRRTSSRKAVVVRLTVAEVEGLIGEAATLQLSCEEIAQAQEKLEEAAAWSEEARGVLEPPAPVTPEVFDHLNDLAKRIEVINMNLAEQGALDDRLGLVRDWMARAKAARADGESPWQLLMGLVKEAKGSGIQLPEVKLLAEQQAEAAWLGQAELALSGAAQLDDLEQLESDAARLAESPKAVEFAGRISEKLALARRWGERLEEEAVGGSARPGLKEAVSLVSECEADRVLLPQLEALKGTVAQAKAWIDSVRRTQSRSTRGVAVRATLPEMRALFEHGQAPPQPAGGGHPRPDPRGGGGGHRAEAALGAHPDDAAAKAAARSPPPTARAARRGGRRRRGGGGGRRGGRGAELAAAAEAASAPRPRSTARSSRRRTRTRRRRAAAAAAAAAACRRLKELVVQSDNLRSRSASRRRSGCARGACV